MEFVFLEKIPLDCGGQQHYDEEYAYGGQRPFGAQQHFAEEYPFCG